MKNTIILSMFFLALVACGNASVRETAEAARIAREASAIAPERANINGLNIGSSEADTVAAFGPPAQITEGFSEVESKPSRTLYYDGIEIFLIADEIYGLECTARRCVTPDGIRVGDPVNKISAIHGPGQPHDRGDGIDAIAYPLSGIDVMLILDLKDGKVIKLTLFFDYV